MNNLIKFQVFKASRFRSKPLLSRSVWLVGRRGRRPGAMQGSAV